ncbi:T9SS type A sorting domain-containing protein [Fluviicola taffensis]|uniref:T9SS type A sorting domain-containing protein n=1 Tax=Fluviicola taffensis TaxID=191579 RepID=UPI003137ECFB
MNRLISILSFIILVSNNGFAQPGTNDPSFNVADDGSFGDGTGLSSALYSSKIQPDGKILVGAGLIFSYAYNGVIQPGLSRINPDGSLDNSFNIGSGFNAEICSISLQTDGKIIVAGNFTVCNGFTRNGIARLNADGSLDTTFNSGTGFPFSSTIQTTVVQTDGKIIAAGRFTSYNGVSRSRIVRINPDGSLDPTFIIGTGFTGLSNSGVSSVKLQTDGKIIAVGTFSGYNGTTRNGITRLNANGSLDATFNPGSGFNGEVWDLDIQTDGKIVAVGVFSSYNSSNCSRVSRINTNGSIDVTFNVGIGFNANYGQTVKIQSDGKIVVGGSFYSYNGTNCYYLTRINSDGTIDLVFNANSGTAIGDWVYNLNIQNDGKIIVLGPCASYNSIVTGHMLRLNVDGSLDEAFNPGTGFDNFVTSTSIQPDGKILLGGDFTEFSSIVQKRITRLYSNGNLDNTFNIGDGFNNSVSTLCIQSDGKILVGGDFTTYNGAPCERMARINPNGSLDSTFDPGSGFDNYVRTICIQGDGKIIVGGNFTTFNGIPQNKIVRLNADGSLDPTFSSSSNYEVKSINIQSDGKIIVGGNLTYYNGNTVYKIIRLNTDGSLDPTFNPGNGPNYSIYSTIIQDDGKIIVGGNFTTFNGLSRNRLVRLNSNGSLDATFNTGSGFDGDVRTISIQEDGKIIVGGNFTTFNGLTRNRIVRLNSNGSLDGTFISGNGFNDEVLSTVVQTDDKIIVAGRFFDYNGTPRNRLVRLLNCFPSNNSFTASACDNYVLNGQNYTSSGVYTQVLINALGCDSIITLDLTIIPSLPLTIDNSFSMPSDANSCEGEVAINLSGNADFELDFDNGSQVLTSSGYSLVTGLCAGVHDLHVTDNCGDTLSIQVVIPVDSNYVFNNPFIDSLAQDSLGVTMTNCDIYYAGIDTAYIDSIWATGNTVNVIWNIVDSNGSNFDTTTYVLNNGNGVYWLQLSVFCPNKSVGEYFTVTEAVYFNNGSVSTAGLADIGKDLFEIYPNPTNDQVHISFSGSDAELIVYDLQGKVVLKDQIKNNGIVSLQNFERGVYLFDFKNSQGHSVQRVIKH